MNVVGPRAASTFGDGQFLIGGEVGSLVAGVGDEWCTVETGIVNTITSIDSADAQSAIARTFTLDRERGPSALWIRFEN